MNLGFPAGEGDHSLTFLTRYRQIGANISSPTCKDYCISNRHPSYILSFFHIFFEIFLTVSKKKIQKQFEELHLQMYLYTVKKIYRIPVFFFTKPFRNGKTPMLTRDFLVPSREGIFCLLRREKYSSLCRGNFFLSVECYISLFPLFPY